MLLRLTRAIEFSTSLRYALPGVSESEGRLRFGDKARQHGHNYRLEVSVRGVPDAATGMVIDLKEIQELLDREIMARFDHRDLNCDTPFFEKQLPTPENLASVIRELLVEALPAGMLDRVRLFESPDTWVEIVEPGATA